MRTPFLHVWTFVFSAAWLFGGGTGSAAEDAASSVPSVAREHHPWARFRVGAWRKARIVEQTLDEDGRVSSQSIIVRTERLREVAEHQFTLEQETEVEVGGQRVKSPPVKVTLGIITDEPGNMHSVAEAQPDPVSLDGQDLPARVLEAVTTGEAYSVGTRLWYAPSEAPYLLRSISEAVAPSSRETIWRRTRKVMARRLPFQVDGENVSSTFWDEQHVSTKGTRQSILVTVDRVPGGIAARWTKEADAEGHLIRREVETLLAWGLDLGGGREHDAGTPQSVGREQGGGEPAGPQLADEP